MITIIVVTINHNLMKSMNQPGHACANTTVVLHALFFDENVKKREHANMRVIIIIYIIIYYLYCSP